MRNDYSKIAAKHYPFANRALSDGLLVRYFDECFDDMFAIWPEYPAWVCVRCATRGKPSVNFDFRYANACVSCRSSHVFQIGTFQSRAARSGRVFQAAVQLLFWNEFGMNLRSTTAATKTHGLDFDGTIAIVAKGSPRKIDIPHVGKMALDRPGMMRRDTVKKVIADARNFKQANRHGRFYVLTNALPGELTSTTDEHIDGFFDVSKANQVRAFAKVARN